MVRPLKVGWVAYKKILRHIRTSAQRSGLHTQWLQSSALCGRAPAARQQHQRLRGKAWHGRAAKRGANQALHIRQRSLAEGSGEALPQPRFWPWHLAINALSSADPFPVPWATLGVGAMAPHHERSRQPGKSRAANYGQRSRSAIHCCRLHGCA